VEKTASGESRPTPSSSLRAALEARQTPSPSTAWVIRISARPGEDSVSYVHEFVSKYAHDRYRAAVAASMSLATFELFMNGVTYGTANADVVLEVGEAGSEVLVRVTNGAIHARIKRLVELVSKLDADARGTYEDQLQKSLLTPGRALLGLARIAHEGGMKLRATVLHGETVTVTASCRR
jgi:hypothetical protein